jgi:hypothetical protein
MGALQVSERIKVLLVGHCLPDSFGLGRLVRRAAPGAQVKRVNSERTLKKAIDGAPLLLVNRELDGRFSQRSGVELIGSLREEYPAIPMMLVSNFPDAQQSAEEAGAAPGIGKNELNLPQAVSKIRAALDRDVGVAKEKPGAVAGQ